MRIFLKPVGGAIELCSAIDLLWYHGLVSRYWTELEN